MRSTSAISVMVLCFCAIAIMSGCGSSSSSFLAMPPPPPPPDPVGSNLTQISSDPFTVSPGQHATEVEPHMFANGAMLVAAFQVGRIAPGCATDIGWATSTNGGGTWTHGNLPGLTTGEGSGPYFAASDPAVAYDAKHGVWMIASLPCGNNAPAVTVSRSSDGVNWQNPVSVDPGSVGSDKDWIVCDNSPTSPFYGNCYTEWDDPTIRMSTSSDGGMSWSVPTTTADSQAGIDGQPLAQPNGNVVVPIQLDSGDIASFSSSDGGTNWSATVTIANSQFHVDAGGIRTGPAVASAIDGAGTVWALWVDCRFRAGCSANDLVYSTTTDGVNWGAVTRVPIDAVSSTADYFIPGIGIDPATSGASAHVGITYYYYPQTNCTLTSCQLLVGFIGSANGGTTWDAPVTLTGPMELSWLANSQDGPMVGDYIATAFSNGVPYGVFAVAQANSGTTFDEAMYTPKGLTVTAAGKQFSSAKDRPLHRLSNKIVIRRPERASIPPQ